MKKFTLSVIIGSWVGIHKDPSATWCFFSLFTALSYYLLVVGEDIIKFFKWRAEQHDTAKHQAKKE